MQEEVEKKSIQLAVRVAGATLKAAFRELMKQKDKLKANLKEKANTEPESPTGKQSVKELIGQGQGVSSMDLESGGLREFNKIAKKYGVDFAIVKDKNADPPKYTCFFKAKDADAILKVMDEYTNKQVKRKERAERPSVLEKLKHFKDIVAKTPRKDKEKKKEHSR